MAKNMESTTYRKLDVDALDDDTFEEGNEAASPTLGVDERNVNQLLVSGRNLDALKAAVTSPPFSSKDQALKDRATTLVAKVLQSFKTSEIESAVSSLSDTEGDNTLKFVYRAFDLIGEPALCQALLAWHAQIVTKFGVGSIVRVLSSRDRL